jgi:soluble lytic murein transglycosylase
MLTGADRAAADRIVAALRDPALTFEKAKTWADEPHAREAIAYGLARYARRNSAAAETAWADLQTRFKWDAAQKNRVLNALALYRATSYSPDALARLKALPADAADDATREWRVRIALTSGDYQETLAALDVMSAPQQADSRWRYLRARVLSKLDHNAEATPILTEVAHEANFYGFLAADWSDQPYTICARTLAGDPKTEAALGSQADLARAFEFRELNMLPEARREWNFAMTKLDENQRRLAADAAYRRGWYDRAVFAFSADPETQRLYEQRFPLGMKNQVKRESRQAGIDPAWAYAIIRAESAWMTDAHSGADAYGLMQLLPGVAKQLAKAEKLPYSNAQDLFDPALNVQLGTRFLGKMADKYEGSPWLASAAYNAGEAPVGRWLDARGALDPDFFIETIPYKETREYVSSVLAFSVIYDWRMNGKVLALSARMPRIGRAYQTPTAQTPRKAVVCAAPNAPAVASAPH